MITNLELENNEVMLWYLMVLELDFCANHPTSLSAFGNWFVVGNKHFLMMQIVDQIPIFCVWIGLEKCRK